MRSIPKPEKIEDIGLETYLNDNFSEAGGYDEFVRRHQDLHEPKTVIANAFGVHRNTVDKWIKIFEKGQLNG